VNYKLHYIFESSIGFLKFLCTIPLIIFPPLLIAVIMMDSVAAGKPWRKRVVEVFAWVPERIAGRWIWLRKFPVEEEYIFLYQSKFGKVYGWERI
jgi:hypothetical protein